MSTMPNGLCAKAAFALNGAVLLGRNLFNDSLWPACGVKKERENLPPRASIAT
jgi:hypothetical protein